MLIRWTLALTLALALTGPVRLGALSQGTTGGLPSGAGQPAAGGQGVSYPAAPLREVERKLAGVAMPRGSALAVGYGADGRLVVWLSGIRRYPYYLQPPVDGEFLAAAAQIFAAAPEVEGVWVAQNHGDMVVAFLERAAYQRRAIPPFLGSAEPYLRLHWGSVSRFHWQVPHFLLDDPVPAVTEHLRSFLGDRLVSVAVVGGGVDYQGLRVVVRHIPRDHPYAAMEEWARLVVAAMGRFYGQSFGTSLDELVWVDDAGNLQLRTGMRHESYPHWWMEGMRPGRWLFYGHPFDGPPDDYVQSWRDLEPVRTSYRGPWWETAAALDPAFARLKAAVPGGRVLFIGRQGGETVAAVQLHPPDSAGREDVWAAHMQAALAVMENPVAEVWVLSEHRTAGRMVSYLDRMGYDALRYPDPKLPPIRPGMWSHAATLYAGESGADR